MSAANKGKDDTIYKHFHSDEHQGLRDIEVHLITRVARTVRIAFCWAHELEKV